MRTFLQKDIRSVLPKSQSSTDIQGGLTHGFVFEFESKDDCNYYVYKDPVHQEFTASLKDIVQNVRVLDYEPGVF